MDFKSKFFDDDINQGIYMQQPLVFIMVDTSFLVCKLNKSLNGLKHALEALYEKTYA